MAPVGFASVLGPTFAKHSVAGLGDGALESTSTPPSAATLCGCCTCGGGGGLGTYGRALPVPPRRSASFAAALRASPVTPSTTVPRLEKNCRRRPRSWGADIATAPSDRAAAGGLGWNAEGCFSGCGCPALTAPSLTMLSISSSASPSGSNRAQTAFGASITG